MKLYLAVSGSELTREQLVTLKPACIRIFYDENMALLKVHKARKLKRVGKGPLSGITDYLIE